MAKSTLRLVRPTTEKRTVTPRRRPNAELRTREHLTEREVERLIEAAKANRRGHRDAEASPFAFVSERGARYATQNWHLRGLRAFGATNGGSAGWT